MAKRFVRPVESRQFLIRRLHSLSGIIPVGVFLFFHIGTNSLIAVSSPSDDLFQKQVNNIHNLGPLLIPVEILFIFVPLFYHAIVGVKIWLESEPNSRYYPYYGNIRYTLQRVTGIATFVFIFIHLYQMHWLGAPLRSAAMPAFHQDAASFTTAQVIQHAGWAVPVYMLGVMCACFHLANGLWTFLITWGVTVGPRSQRVSGLICTMFGIAMTLTGLVAVRGFAAFDVSKQPIKSETSAQVQPSPLPLPGVFSLHS